MPDRRDKQMAKQRARKAEKRGHSHDTLQSTAPRHERDQHDATDSGAMGHSEEGDQ
jgi:hypothetical protein